MNACYLLSSAFAFTCEQNHIFSIIVKSLVIHIIHAAQSLCSLQDGRHDAQSTFLIRHILKVVKVLPSRMPISILYANTQKMGP